MAVERTLSIIKPDAVSKNVIGQIYTRFEQAGLKIVASRMTHLTEKEAGGFYAVSPAPDGSVWGSVLGFPGTLVRLTPGSNPSETALAEVYDTTSSDAFSTATPRLTNVSALTQVGTGGDILIAGFYISGSVPKRVLTVSIALTDSASATCRCSKTCRSRSNPGNESASWVGTAPVNRPSSRSSPANSSRSSARS